VSGPNQEDDNMVKKTTKTDKPPAPAVVVNYNEADLKGERKAMGGSMHDTWNNLLAGQAISTLWTANSTPEDRDRQNVATIAALHGIKPRDELEGMMAAQLLAAHNAAMECYRRAMIGEQTSEGRQDNLNQANKLSRTYTTLLEALNRHRGKGQQTVRVEHVTVNGNAVVGDVHHGVGTGGQAKLEGQSHALEYAPGQTLWSENAQREAVQVAGNGEER
jgi:hypothetical protein